MKPSKGDANAIVKILDQDHATVDDAAKAVAEVAFERYESRARFMVFGQIWYANGYLDHDDERAARVILGPFATRKQATDAGESLAFSNGTGEAAKWAAAPLWHGTPSAWYRDRAKVREQAAQATSLSTPPRELRHQHIMAWLEQNPGETTLPEHLQGNGWEGLDRYMEWRESNAGQCRHCEGTGRITKE